MKKWLILLAVIYIGEPFAKQDQCDKPAHKCQALELYAQAKEKNQNNDWQAALVLAKQAIELVSIDGKLDYIFLCESLEGEGYVSVVVFRDCKRRAEYLPNAIVTKIKQAHPPSPYVFVSFSHQQNGWQVTDLNVTDNVIANRFVVTNDGQSAMDTVTINLADDKGHQINQNKTLIDAGSNWTGTLNTSGLTPSVKVSLTEKDDYGLSGAGQR